MNAHWYFQLLIIMLIPFNNSLIDLYQVYCLCLESKGDLVIFKKSVGEEKQRVGQSQRAATEQERESRPVGWV